MRINSKLVVLTSVLLYVIIHYFLRESLSHINSDYLVSVNNIVESGGLIKNKHVLNRVPPILPIVISAFVYLSNITGVNVLIFSSIYSILLIHLIGLMILKYSSEFNFSHNNKIILFLIITLNPLSIYYTLKPFSELSFALVLLLSLFFLKSTIKKTTKINFILFNIFFFFTLLIRPNFLPIIFMPFLVIFYLRLQKKFMFLSVLSFVLVIGPWMAVNFWYNSEIVISSKGNVSSLRDGVVLDNKDFRSSLTYDEEIRFVMDSMWANYEYFDSNGKVIEYYLFHLNNNFSGILKFQILKVTRVFFGTDSINKKQEIFIGLLSIPVFLLSLIYFIRIRDNPSFDLIFIFLLVFSVLLSSIVVPLFRYIFPFFLLSIPLALRTLNYYSFYIWKKQ